MSQIIALGNCPALAADSNGWNLVCFNLIAWRYWLSEQRQKRNFMKSKSTFKRFRTSMVRKRIAEACLVYLRWAGYATDEQIHDAIRTATVVSGWQHCTKWNRVVEWLTTTMLNERCSSCMPMLSNTFGNAEACLPVETVGLNDFPKRGRNIAASVKTTRPSVITPMTN